MVTRQRRYSKEEMAQRGQSLYEAENEDKNIFLPVSHLEKKESLSLQEAIAQLRVPLKTALTKGYSYSELARLLQQVGILISGSELRNYLTSDNQRKSTTTVSKKSKDKNLPKTLEQPSSDVEMSIPAKTELSSFTEGIDFWSAYQASLRERKEVYRRLAES